MYKFTVNVMPRRAGQSRVLGNGLPDRDGWLLMRARAGR